MIHIQYLISTKEKEIFWIKPLWCPLARPFCISRWNQKQGINVCPCYSGVRRETYGPMYVWCKYDELPNTTARKYTYNFKLSVSNNDMESKLNTGAEIPDNCPRCIQYLGDICITNGEFRTPCDDFKDVITWLQTASLFRDEEDR